MTQRECGRRIDDIPHWIYHHANLIQAKLMRADHVAACFGQCFTENREAVVAGKIVGILKANQQLRRPFREFLADDIRTHWRRAGLEELHARIHFHQTAELGRVFDVQTHVDGQTIAGGAAEIAQSAPQMPWVAAMRHE